MLESSADSSLPPADLIRQTANEIISRPYYHLEGREEVDTARLRRLLEWLLTPFRWLFDCLEGLPDFLRWVIVVLAFLICIAMIAHIIYTFLHAIRGPVRGKGPSLFTTKPEVDPAQLEARARAASSDGDYLAAVRLLFQAALRRLEIAEKRKLRPGCTNRELLRRYQNTPLFGPLSQLVRTLDLKWYGSEPCDQSDYVACHAEHGKISQYVATLPTTNRT